MPYHTTMKLGEEIAIGQNKVLLRGTQPRLGLIAYSLNGAKHQAIAGRPIYLKNGAIFHFELDGLKSQSRIEINAPRDVLIERALEDTEPWEEK